MIVELFAGVESIRQKRNTCGLVAEGSVRFTTPPEASIMIRPASSSVSWWPLSAWVLVITWPAPVIWMIAASSWCSCVPSGSNAIPASSIGAISSSCASLKKAALSLVAKMPPPGFDAEKPFFPAPKRLVATLEVAMRRMVQGP